MIVRVNSKSVKVGNLIIGGNDDIIIQSMCNIKTSNVEEVIKQILTLEEYGCRLIRVSVWDEDDALAIKSIKKHIHIPIVADIHFDYKLALLSIESGVDKIRINPGNIGSVENIKKVVDACLEKHIPIRIGVNSGSLEKDLLDKYGVSEVAMIESAKRHVSILENLGFYDIVISLKSSDYKLTEKAYELASEVFSYPLHIGVTETGPLIPGIIKSSLCLSNLLDKGIGNTIRISLSDDPIYEIKVAKQLLAIKGLIKMPTLISCPTCGRTQINLISYVNEIEDYLYKVNKNIKVAIMGCIVNGPGEAKEADIGVAGGNKKAVIFKKDKIIKTVDEKDIIKALKEEIDKL